MIRGFLGSDRLKKGEGGAKGAEEGREEEEEGGGRKQKRKVEMNAGEGRLKENYSPKRSFSCRHFNSFQTCKL